MMLSFLAFASFLLVHTPAARVKSPSLTKTLSGPLVDVTDVIKNKEKPPARGKRGVKCCCDTSSGLVDMFSNSGRTGRCNVFEIEKSGCSDMTSQELPSWSGGRPLRHYINQGSCKVNPYDVPDVYDKYGSPANYCRAIDSETLTVGVAAVKASAVVQCKAGYATTQPRATCTYLTASKGRFVPTPECIWKEDWCAGAQISNEEYWSGAPWMVPAALGATSHVHCSFAKVPEVKKVTCGKDRLFSPIPKCIPKPDFCKAYETFEVKWGSVEMAPYGEQREVKCAATGYIPQTSHVLCEQSDSEHEGAFMPGPLCIKDPFFCPAIEADMYEFMKGTAANVDAGPLDEDQQVRCRQGSNPSSFSVRCGSDGKFYPQPTCSKIDDWCATIESEFEDGLFVYKAGRGDMAAVKCSYGYVPELPHVWCEKSRQFEPQPKCIKKADE